jgi:outer membrane protein TolC
VAVADLFPRFNLTAMAGLQSSETATLFNSPSRYFNLMPGVSVPLFDAGQRRAEIELRRAQQEQALVRYQQTVLNALSETENAIVGLQTEQRRAASLRESVAAYQEASDIALEQYRQGLTDFLTVLEAQRNLYQQQEALARSEQAVTTELIALYKALGGGWEATLPLQANEAAPGEQHAAR